MYVIFHISCLPYYYCIFLLAEFRGSPFWHLSRRWRYRALSLRLTVLPVAAGLSAWRPFAFSAQTDKIFTHDYTEIVSSLKCTWYFCIFVLFCLNKFFTVYHYNTLSLFSLKAGGRQVDDIFVAVSIVICRSTNCGATVGAVSLTIFCFSELDYHDIQTRFYCDTYIIGMYMISLYNCFLCFDNLSAISL